MRAEVVRASRAKRVRPLAVAGMPASVFYQNMTDSRQIGNIIIYSREVMASESAESDVVLLFFVLFLEFEMG
eukprot:scaffold84630_cov93-Cyclotella_meneghiniana.AAC.1